MSTGGRNLSDKLTVVHAFGPAVPSSAAPDWISLKDADGVLVVIQGLNGSTVTGSAVTLSQATLVNGQSAKALAFSRYYANVDPANSSVKTTTTAASNTFTTTNTNTASYVYEIPIDKSDLDVANGFDCVRVALGNATNATIAANYVVFPAYGGKANSHANMVVD